LTASDREVVAALEQALVRRLGEPRYNLWFKQHTRFTHDDGLLVVGVSNLHFQDWLAKKFGADVEAAAAEVFGQPVRVVFRIEPELFQAARREQERVRAQPEQPAAKKTPEPPARPARPPTLFDEQPQEPRPSPRTKQKPPPPEPDSPAPAGPKRRWHRLAEFIVGPCNRVAHASALSVVEAPGQGANPLVIHGPVGTGKTHLLEGIYAGLRRSQPHWRVCYATAESFTNRFLQAMHAGKLGPFRRHFRECQALLLDDAHFLARKKATQEEFLHTFDVLLAEGAQVVLTCDCHPRLADEFLPELTDRLLGGVIWGLTPPDADTRLQILQARALRLGEPAFPEGVLQYLAAQLRGNVRELEGALQSVRHYGRVTGRRIDLGLVREALADLLRHAVRVVQLADVDHAVCRVLRLETGALQSKQRAWAVSHPRMVAMFLSRKHTAATYTEVGQYFGGRNHSTAVAAEKKVRQWLQDDHELALGERRVRVRDVVELVERDLLR
jgi:chromosomal replication initiator protein